MIEAAAFVRTHMLLWIYLLIINFAAFIVFAADKVRAVQGKWRIREAVLLGMSLMGGAAGGLISMHMMRHKTRSPRFVFGLPVMILAQAALLAYWIVRTV